MRGFFNFDKRSKNQYLATLSVNLLTIAYGTSTGWPSSSFLLLESIENTPLPSGALTVDELSWISSLLCLGGIFGTLLFGWLASYISKKNLLIATALPQITSWLLIIFAENAIYLYVSRFLCGITAGGVFVLIPLFISEIASDNVRGTLGSLLMVCGNFGILISFIVGHYLDFIPIACVHIAFPTLFLLTFLFFPDTPYHFLKFNEEKKAEKSLMFYRNLKSNDIQIQSQYQHEVSVMKKNFETKAAQELSKKITWEDITSRAAKKSILIGVILILVHELCGVFVMLNYTASIFAESGSNISPNLSAIVVGFIQVIGTIVATQLIDRAGRKFLFILSSIGSAISLAILGTYSFLNTLGYPVHEYSWVSIISFSIYLFLASCGMIPLPYIVMAETIPEKIRSLGTSICMCLSWTLSFVLVKVFAYLGEAVGMFGSIYFFAGCCICGCIIIVIIMPETKGKSYDEIRDILDK